MVGKLNDELFLRYVSVAALRVVYHFRLSMLVAIVCLDQKRIMSKCVDTWTMIDVRTIKADFVSLI